MIFNYIIVLVCGNWRHYSEIMKMCFYLSNVCSLFRGESSSHNRQLTSGCVTWFSTLIIRSLWHIFYIWKPYFCHIYVNSSSVIRHRNFELYKYVSKSYTQVFIIETSYFTHKLSEYGACALAFCGTVWYITNFRTIIPSFHVHANNISSICLQILQIYIYI